MAIIDGLRKARARQLARDIFALRTRAEETGRDFSKFIAPLRAELSRLVAYAQCGSDINWHRASDKNANTGTL